MLTAHETTGSCCATFPLPKTRVWGSNVFGSTRIGGSSDLSPISRWGCTLCSYDSASARLVYDNNGNTLVSGARTFKYDFQNRLKSMTNSANGVAATIVYDGDGNRAAKTVNGTTTKYLVDDLNPTGYAQVVEELTNGVVTRTYTYGLQRINENQLLGGSQSSAVWTASFYGYDGMGSVRMLTDTTGAVTDTYEFDGWGNVVASTGSTPNVYLYRGEQFDPDLQLYYLRARYFNPLTGRFLTRDPANGQMTDPKSLHKYLYAGGDPINMIDPTGRQDMIETTQLDNISVSFTDHGAAHLVNEGVAESQAEVESAIEKTVKEIISCNQYVPQSWQGCTLVNGMPFIYRVWIVTQAYLAVSVGTYWPAPPL